MSPEIGESSNEPVVIPVDGSIFLRELTTQHDDEAYFSSVEISRDHLIKYEPRVVNDSWTLEDVRNTRLSRDPNTLCLGIWDGDVFVGTVSRVLEDRQAEIGYWLDVRHTGKGYATKAVKALADYISANDDVWRICGVVLEDNDKSANVLQRAGFTEVVHTVGRRIFDLLGHDMFPDPDDYLRSITEEIEKEYEAQLRAEELRASFERIGCFLVYQLRYGDSVEVSVSNIDGSDPTSLLLIMDESQPGRFIAETSNDSCGVMKGQEVCIGSYSSKAGFINTPGPGLLPGTVQDGSAVVVDTTGLGFISRGSNNVYLPKVYSGLKVNDIPFFAAE